MKKTILAGALLVSLSSSSCLGPDHAYNSVKNWNAEVTDQDWLNELIFLGLHIIPVYGVALFGDFVIFNTSGYWGGNYIISDPGPFPGFKRGM
jgi:hypothetical protein